MVINGTENPGIESLSVRTRCGQRDRLTRMMPAAPALAMLLSFVGIEQVPSPLVGSRSTSTIFPATWAAFVSAVHACCGAAKIISSVTSNTCGPNEARPTFRLPAAAAGERTLNEDAPPPYKEKMYICMRGLAPSAGVYMLALLEPL